MFMNNRKCGCEMPNMCGPIMEAPIEKCIQKNIVHEKNLKQVHPYCYLEDYGNLLHSQHFH